METLAISLSDNANRIAGSIRAKLKEEDDNKVEPIIEEDMIGVESFVTLQAQLNARKSLIFTNVDRLMKCLHVRYSRIEGGKTIYCELFVKNRHSGREHVIAYATAQLIFIEQQDIPRAEQVAFERARKLAGDFFNNMCLPAFGW